MDKESGQPEGTVTLYHVCIALLHVVPVVPPNEDKKVEDGQYGIEGEEEERDGTGDEDGGRRDDENGNSEEEGGGMDEDGDGSSDPKCADPVEDLSGAGED